MFVWLHTLSPVELALVALGVGVVAAALLATVGLIACMLASPPDDESDSGRPEPKPHPKKDPHD